jgi:hypothetical protein
MPQAEKHTSTSTEELSAVDELDGVIADCRTLLNVLIDGLDKPMDTDDEIPWSARDLHDTLLLIRTRLKDVSRPRDVWNAARQRRSISQ